MKVLLVLFRSLSRARERANYVNLSLRSAKRRLQIVPEHCLSLLFDFVLVLICFHVSCLFVFMFMLLTLTAMDFKIWDLSNGEETAIKFLGILHRESLEYRKLYTRNI